MIDEPGVETVWFILLSFKSESGDDDEDIIRDKMNEPDESERKALFEAFYARTAPSLWSYIFRICGDAALTDDIRQDSYLRYLRSVRVEANEREQKAFVFKIASRLLIDNFRRIKPGPLETAERRNLWERAPEGLSPDLRRLLDALKPRERSLLWLAYVEGYNHEEIADILNLKTKSVKVLLFRLRSSVAASLRSKGYRSEEYS